MIKKLFISIFFCFISCSLVYSQKTDFEIKKEYQRIENLKTLIIDSLTLNRGIDFSRGSNADVKKYKIFKEKKKIIKMEYEEINNGYREWNKKTKIYFKNDIPFFITEKTNGIVTFYSDAGEKSEPYQKNEEIYIYDWKHEKFKKLNNGQDA